MGAQSCAPYEPHWMMDLHPFAELDYAEQLKRLTQAGQAVLAQYGMGSAEIAPVVYVNNAVFQVTSPDHKRYALRLTRSGQKPMKWTASEVFWLKAIRHKTTLQVPQPMMTTNSEILTSVPVEGLDDPVNAVLFGWIEGQFFQNEDIPLESVRQSGEFLGRLHDYSATFLPPANFVRPRLDWEGLFGEESAYNPGDGARIFTSEQKTVFASVEANVQTVMEDIGQKSETFGLIHGDFIAKNWLFNEEGMAALDFDDCSWGYYLYDLAPALLQFKYEPRYRALREAFLQGYGAVRALSQGDNDHLETLMGARHLASCRWLAGHLHHPRIRERASELIAQRSGELKRFLETGSLDGRGPKEFF